ncbi:hypothetical protein F5B22DRAFT_628302 [Xylaria bambusicola]|uniref:uncharacterized protein n=1 Tax=Xylaria bambusicola TaxID=326684 RepID=UPI002007F048|nr:uncharacterized protein F5B22DRAFT_628302 [Xylaria bambusicola]KAI0505359.1 hypothetical protein F5B22DRAFT_628302 [Xylaria bambusicola]
MESSELPGACLICNKPDAKPCSRCKSALYCSEPCQRADYPVHKLLCASFSSDLANRPTKNSIRAILFPVSSVKPKMIWLEIMQHGDWKYWVPQYLPNDPIESLDSTPKTNVEIDYDFILKRRLSDVVCLAYRDNMLMMPGTCELNNSITSITATRPGALSWRFVPE